MRPLVALVSTLAAAGALLSVPAGCGGDAFVAGTQADAAPDTAGAPTFCAIEGGTATFCDDFDGPPLTSKWTAIDVTTGSTIQDDGSLFVSAPNSLESQVPTSLNLGAAQKGRVEKTFSSASLMTVSFQVHIDAVADKPATGSVAGTSFLMVVLGDISVGLAANALEVSYFEDQTTDAGDTGILSGNVVPTPTVKGDWVPAVLQIDLKNALLTATVSGTTVGPVPFTPPAGAGAAPEVYLGLQARNVDLPLEAHYDNVLIDVTP